MYQILFNQSLCLQGNLSKYKSLKLHRKTMNLISKIRFCLTILNKIITILIKLSIIKLQAKINIT